MSTLPRLTPEQQALALRKLHAQAEQRVQLGSKLLEAADARLQQHQSALDVVRQENAQLREAMRQEFAESIETAQSWQQESELRLTERVEAVEQRLTTMETQWAASIGQLEAALAQAQGLLHSAKHPSVGPDEPVVTDTTVFRQLLDQLTADSAE